MPVENDGVGRHIITFPHPDTVGNRYTIKCSRCAHGYGDYIVGYKEPGRENVNPLNGHYICDDCVRVMSNPGDDNATQEREESEGD